MSGRLDLDLLRGLLRLRGFGQHHLEDAVLERRGDLIGVDALGQAEIALERAVATLGDVVVLLLFVGLFFLFALDGDSAVGDAYLDVLFVHSWHFRRDLVGLVRFRDVDSWSGDGNPLRPAPLKCGQLPEWASPEVLTEILKQVIDLLPECLERTLCLAGERWLASLLRSGKFGFICHSRSSHVWLVW